MLLFKLYTIQDSRCIKRISTSIFVNVLSFYWGVDEILYRILKRVLFIIYDSIIIEKVRVLWKDFPISGKTRMRILKNFPLKSLQIEIWLLLTKQYLKSPYGCISYRKLHYVNNAKRHLLNLRKIFSNLRW